MSEIGNCEQAAERLIEGQRPLDEGLFLALDGCRIAIRSNSADLLQGLRHYFAHVLSDDPACDLEVVAIERGAPDLGIEFVEWKREPGKSGRKDSYHDLPGGRLIYKVRTGMVFLQSETRRIAAGSCVANDNQVINFINAQYMNWLQQHDWLICHASGLVHGNRCLGIAGFSGGGKSTLMLHLLDHDGVNYLTNDRLFVRAGENGVDAVGVPKLPRVNPGTIVHNPRLHGLLSEQRRAELLAMPTQELWHLEEKYDVLVGELYGAGRITQRAPLGGFLILNWRHGSDQPLQVDEIGPARRRELLGALMKSPGPFYQYADGSFYQDDTALDEAHYLAVLAGVPIYEASGGVDFDALTRYCLDELLQE